MIIKTTRDNIMEVLEYLEKEGYFWWHNTLNPTTYNPYDDIDKDSNENLVLSLEDDTLCILWGYEKEEIRTLEDLKRIGLE